MKISMHVKKVALSKFLVGFIIGLNFFSSVSRAIPPQYPCGVYRVHGQVFRQDGRTTLVMQGPQQSHQEFILLGGPFYKKISMDRRYVEATIYVPEYISSETKPYAFLQEIKAATYRIKPGATLIKNESCRATDRYVKTAMRKKE